MAKKKSKQKVGSPVKSLRGNERRYQMELAKFGKALAQAIREEVLPMLKAHQASYVIDETYAIDGIGSDLNRIFEVLNQRFTGVFTAAFAKNTAERAVNKAAKSNKARFDRTVSAMTGVDLGSIIATEGLEDFMQLSISKNVSLIKSLPEQYLSQVETIINNGVVNGAKYKTIAKEITAKTGSANSKLAARIKTIATNEIQTINSQLTLRRSDNLGITRGIFRTSKDEKVRKCHRELNGVEFELKKGAWSESCQKFIQPGITDIHCRCSYSPIIEVD